MKHWRFKFVPRDCWIGTYFDRYGRIYFAPIPMIVFVYYRKSYWRMTKSGTPSYYHPKPNDYRPVSRDV